VTIAGQLSANNGRLRTTSTNNVLRCLTVNGASDADPVVVVNSTGPIRLNRDVLALGNLELGGDLLVDGATRSIGALTVPSIFSGAITSTGPLTAPSITGGILNVGTSATLPSTTVVGSSPISDLINSQARSVIRAVFRV
jgi:hypothetical protein